MKIAVNSLSFLLETWNKRLQNGYSVASSCTSIAIPRSGSVF